MTIQLLYCYAARGMHDVSNYKVTVQHRQPSWLKHCLSIEQQQWNVIGADVDSLILGRAQGAAALEKTSRELCGLLEAVVCAVTGEYSTGMAFQVHAYCTTKDTWHKLSCSGFTTNVKSPGAEPHASIDVACCDARLDGKVATSVGVILCFARNMLRFAGRKIILNFRKFQPPSDPLDGNRAANASVGECGQSDSLGV